MSEGPSDPDLLDLEGLPDTASVAGVRDGGMTARIVEAVKSLARWATRQHLAQKRATEEAEETERTRKAEMRELRLWLLGILGTVLVSVAGAIWQARGFYDEVRAIREDLAEHESEHASDERRWHRVDVSTHATEEP